MANLYIGVKMVILKWKTYYRNGKPIGIWKFYDEDGILERTENKN
jgi:antitoxin component YwqK of YwqJK toxin-antitoxin module